MSAPTYTIKTVADFLLVPADRLDECLREFRQMLDMAREAESMLVSVGEIGGLTRAQIGFQLVPCFEWIDDGLGNVSMTIEAADAETPTAP